MYYSFLRRLIDQNVDVIYNKNVSKSPAAKKDEDPLPSSSPHPSPTQASVHQLWRMMCNLTAIQLIHLHVFI